MIIYRGTLTLEKLKELAAEHLQTDDSSFNPKLNPYAISIIRQEDGNYIAQVQKNGKLVETRTNDPQTALLGLITHDGN